MLEPELTRPELFVIGTSAGGIDVLGRLLPAFFKTDLFKVAIVIHLPPEGPNLVPSLLRDATALVVKEPFSGDPLLPDHVYVAPPDYHLCIEPDGTLSLSSEGPVNFSRPSIDILFESAAFAYSKRTIGILLTGANNDGALGLRKIQEAGGITIVQDPNEAQFNAMPTSALKIMTPDFVFTVKELVEFIQNLCLKRT